MSTLKSITVPDTIVLGASSGDVSTALTTKPIVLNDVREAILAWGAGENGADIRDATGSAARSLRDLDVTFTNKGLLTAKFRGTRRDGKAYTPMFITSTAASQLAREILPKGYFPGTRTLAAIDDDGAKLANRTWEKFRDQLPTSVLRYGRRRPYRHTLRTFKVPVPGHSEPQRVLRAVLSEKYGVYDHPDLCRDIAAHGAMFAALPVLGWAMSYDHFRCNLSALEMTQSALGEFDPSYLMEGPVPMIQLWNSETGCRSVGIRAGVYRFDKGFGITHWLAKHNHFYNHSKNVGHRVGDALADVMSACHQVVEAYQMSQNIEVEDWRTFMEDRFATKRDGEVLVPTAVQDKARKALEALGEVVMLSDLIDEVNIAAQSSGLDTQDNVAFVASKAMKWGIDNHDNFVLYPKTIQQAAN